MKEPIKLTKARVKALECPPGTSPKKGHTIPDSEMKGLRVTVFPSGSRRWKVYFRTFDGVQRWQDIGDAAVLTPAEARQVARELLVAVARGKDPSQERQDRRAAPTVGDLLTRYEAEHLSNLKPKTRKGYGDIIRRHLRPLLGSKKVASLDLGDTQALHGALSTTPRLANLALAVLSSTLTFAERIGWRPVRSNPCPAVRRFPERQVHRPLNDLEVARLARALREAETGDPPEAAENPRAVAALRLLWLTGMRRNEALRLRWAEVDLEAGQLRLEDHKTARHEGAKIVRLNAAARDLLEAQEPMVGSPFVFPSPTKPLAPLYDIKGVWTRIRSRAGLADVRLHDLRHSFAAAAAGAGLTLHQIGQLLGHRHPATTQRYAGLVDDAAARAAEQVGEALARAMGLAPAREPAARRGGGR